MDTMGIIWLIVYLVIGVVAACRLASTPRTHNNQKYNNDETSSVKGITKGKQRPCCFIVGTSSNGRSNESNNDTQKHDGENSYPQDDTTSIAGGK